MPVKGMAEFRKRLESLRVAAPAIVDVGLYALGLRIVGAAMEGTPIRYGFLRRAHYASPAVDHVVKVGNGMCYARRLEYGSPSWAWTEPGTGPHFMQRAWDAEVARAPEFLARWTEDYLAKAGGPNVPPRPSSPIPTSPPDLNAEARDFYKRARASLRKRKG